MALMPTIRRGTRAFFAGSTGSGKTTLATEFIKRTSQHAVIFNPKHTAGYNRLPGAHVLDDVKMEKIERSIARNKFTLLNLPSEYFEAEYQDEILKYLHLRFNNIMLVADELSTLHKNGRSFRGLKSVLALGRELNQTFIGLTQRPSWIDRSVISEADYLGIMRLNLLRDRKTVNEEIGNPAVLHKLDDRKWFWYDVQADNLRLFNPLQIS
jgi:DNA helicase HerA-like ATPase